MNTKKIILLALSVSLALFIWFTPTPEGLRDEAWHLFAIFISTIFSIMVGALPIFVASIIALAATIFTGLLTSTEAFSGFGKGFIILIVVAFLVARAVVVSGLGKRIALNVIALFGKSSLGLGYSMFFTDLLIAPAFPSNTARSGVLYPLTLSLALDSGSEPTEASRKKLGNFLMMNTMAGLSISSALWFTAMAANPTGAALAQELGVNITFFSWLKAAVVPCLIAAALLPYVLYKIISPEIKQTPEAPKNAREELKKLGKISTKEIITLFTFVAMVIMWALSAKFDIDKTAVAFVGLAILMVTKVFTLEELKTQGGALSTFIWFAILYTLSSFLNTYGFMDYIGVKLANGLVGYSWQMVYIILIVSYVFIHYFFVSQTAQMLALFSVFLSVGMNAGVPGELLALMLLFATNFNSVITPQGSSANVLSVGSGYLLTREIYLYGGIVTCINLVIFLVFGTAWMWMLGMA